MRKKILIMMSTFNGEKVIEQQLNSILNQTIIDRIDILIRDDGSEDNTLDILKRYEGVYSNIKVIGGNNIGFNNSYFQLMNYDDKYDYYAFSDQDDKWFKNKVEIAIAELEKYDTDIPLLYGSCSLVVDDLLNGENTTQTRKKEINIRNAIIQNILPGHTQVYNNKLHNILKKDINANNIYVYDSWVTMVACFFGKIIFDNEYHTYYIQHDVNAFGYGRGIRNWVRERLRRTINGDTKKFTLQCIEFLSVYNDELKDCKKKILLDFIDQKTVFKRILYLFRYRPHRQRNVETFIFYILYILGKYKVNR